ncbi:monovalent cation/H(+) antiporter subunit G [Planctomycetota bacterium]|nr:monovalent cation/H(+) antiporter subunit G [Planctomycetota bacterium]
MEIVLDIFTWACLGLGCFFSLTAAIGVLRMPDFFSRLHPAGKNDTMGLFFFMFGMLAETLKYEYGYLVAGKLVAIILFVFVTSPIATHAITKAAMTTGLEPWKKGDSKEDKNA